MPGYCDEEEIERILHFNLERVNKEEYNNVVLGNKGTAPVVDVHFFSTDANVVPQGF